MPDRLISLVVLAGFWVPPAVIGWSAAQAANRTVTAAPSNRTTGGETPARPWARLALTVIGWSLAWFLVNLVAMPPYVPGATEDPNFAPPEAVAWLALIAGAGVLPGSAIACAVAYRLRSRATSG